MRLPELLAKEWRMCLCGMLAAGIFLGGVQALPQSEQTHAEYSRTADPSAIDLEAKAPVFLSPGSLVAIKVPFQSQRPIQLNTVHLTLTLERNTTEAGSNAPKLKLEADLRYGPVKIQGNAEELYLYASVPEITPQQAGDYHAFDYDVQLGSATEAPGSLDPGTLLRNGDLADRMEALRITLKPAPAKTTAH